MSNRKNMRRGMSVSEGGTSLPTRREFLKTASWAGLSSALAGGALVQEGGFGFDAEAAAATGATGSDVGSLFPFIQRQAVRGEFPLSFLNPKFQSPADWRQEARAKVLELLHYRPAPCAPMAETTDKLDCGDHVRETVWFNTTPDIRTPAFVLVPKGLRTQAPGIVALHDHGGFYLWGKEKIVALPEEPAVLSDFKRNYYGGRSIATELARQGYVVAVIDMFYWGERRMILDADPEDWRQRPPTLTRERVQAFNSRAGQAEQLVGRTLFAAGLTWPGIIFWDDIRTVDYLLTRPEVDPERIGCVGLSVGGLRSCHLAALDDRVKAAVAVGWMASFPRQLKTQVRNTIGHTKIVPGLYRYMDYPDVASMALPKPLLVINGSKDGLFDLEGVRASFSKLHACYQKAGAADRLQTRLYDTPHEFNLDMQTEAWAWLKQWL